MKFPTTSLAKFSTLGNTFKQKKSPAFKIGKIDSPKTIKPKMDITQFTGARTTSDSKAEGRLKVAANAGKTKIIKTAIAKLKKKK